MVLWARKIVWDPICRWTTDHINAHPEQTTSQDFRPQFSGWFSTMPLQSPSRFWHVKPCDSYNLKLAWCLIRHCTLSPPARPEDKEPCHVVMVPDKRASASWRLWIQKRIAPGRLQCARSTWLWSKAPRLYSCAGGGGFCTDGGGI